MGFRRRRWRCPDRLGFMFIPLSNFCCTRRVLIGFSLGDRSGLVRRGLCLGTRLRHLRLLLFRICCTSCGSFGLLLGLGTRSPMLFDRSLGRILSDRVRDSATAALIGVGLGSIFEQVQV